MHCMDCGAEVPVSAKFCPGCGKPTAAHRAPAPAARAPAKSKARRDGAIALGLGGLVVLALVFGGSGRQPAGPTAPQQPAIATTAEALYRAYDANEAAAQQQFGDARLDVTGTVAGVNLDVFNDPIVLLKTSNQFQSVHAKLADSSKPGAGSLAKGQEVMLHCSNVHEIIGTPMLDECSF